MTVEFERKDLLNMTVSTEVLKPGSAKILEPLSFMRPESRLDVISEDEIRIRKSFAGEVLEDISLEKDQINRSRHTYSYLRRFNIAWKRS